MIKVTGKFDVRSRVVGMPIKNWMQREAKRIGQDPLRDPEIVEKIRSDGVKTIQMVDHGQVEMQKESTPIRINREVKDFHGRWRADPIGGGS